MVVVVTCWCVGNVSYWVVAFSVLFIFWGMMIG